MARKKCVICGEWIEEDEKTVKVKTRYAHERCFNVQAKVQHKEKQKELNQKKKNKTTKSKSVAELQDNLSEEEFQYKKNYYALLKDLLKTEQLSAKIYTLSDNYFKKYATWTWENMYHALWYWYVYLENEVKGDCVGYLPYIYDKSLKELPSIKKIQEHNEEIMKQQLYTQKTQLIKVKKYSENQLDITQIGSDNN